MNNWKDLWYKPEEGFLSADKFARLLREKGYQVPRKEINEFIKAQHTYQVTRQPNLPSTYSTYWVHKVRDNYQIDLIVYDRYEFNHYKYILCVIDIKSRYAQAEALTNRSQQGNSQLITKLTAICERMGWPKGISADQEFNTVRIRNLFQDHGVSEDRFQFSEPRQLHKNPIVERWHRTLAGRLSRWRRSQPGLRNWVKVLPEIVKGYNNSYHRTLHAKPIDVWEGRAYNRQPIIEKPTPFQVGDKVRYRLDKPTFYKGDRITYSPKVYTIAEQKGKRYSLESEDGAILKRTRAAYELIRADRVEQEVLEEEPSERQRRLPKNDTNPADIRTDQRQPKPKKVWEAGS